jgi:hypothetical protein
MWAGMCVLCVCRSANRIVCVLIVLHYVKREMETLWIHKFSHQTMPVRNLVKNCAHYWIIGGLFMAYFLYHPKFTSLVPGPVVLTLALLFIVGRAIESDRPVPDANSAY